MFAFMDAIESPPLQDNQKSFCNIEAVHFIVDLQDFLAQPEYNNDIDEALRMLAGRYTQYSDQAVMLETQYSSVQVHIEEAKSNLMLVHKLQDKQKNFKASRFQLIDGLYLSFDLEPVDKVVLHLGINTMLEYSLSEAEDYLKEQITKHIIEHLQLEHDLDYLKDQLTTAESNISRVFNYGVDLKSKTGDGADVQLQ